MARASGGRARNINARSRLSAEERREQIVVAARQVFEQSGFDGARTRDLAAAAGVNEALLYRHFASKEELFEAAVAGPLEAAVAKLVKLAGEPPDTFDSSGAVMHQRTYQFIYDLMGVIEEIGPLLGVVLFGQAVRAGEYFQSRIDPSLKRIEEVIEANLPAWHHKEFDIGLAVRLVVGGIWFISTTDKLCQRNRDRAATAEAVTATIIEGVSISQAVPNSIRSRDA